MLFRKESSAVQALKKRAFELEQYSSYLESEYEYLLKQYRKCVSPDFCRYCVYGEKVEYHQFPKHSETAVKQVEYLCKKDMSCQGFQKRKESVLNVE